MKEIPPTVVIDLIRLGVIGEIDSSQEREIATRLGPFDWVDRLGWASWDAVTEKLLLKELHCLARGLVRAERIERWGGGSVAGAIWVFRMLQRRFPQEADVLAEWMLASSNNPWIPFGGDRGSARSLAELKRYHEVKAARRRASAADADLKRHLRQVREAVHCRIADERRALQTGASSVRMQLLDKLRALSLRERIEHVAWDDSHPLAFYPADLVEGPLQQLCEVDTVSLQRLVSKAAARRRGAWRAWLGRLREACAESPAIAIAHGLEDLCEVKAPEKKAKRGKKVVQQMDLEGGSE